MISAERLEEIRKRAELPYDTTEWVARRDRIDLLSHITDLETKLGKCVEALEFYAKGRHFEFGGLLENEPETPSGEPQNVLCGGTDGHEYTYEDGWTARDALSQIRELGEKNV